MIIRKEKDATYNNLLDMYLKDSIGRNNELHRFIQLLNNIEGPCSIAVNGKWGTGKTYFVKQTMNIINALNDNGIQKDNSKLFAQKYKQENGKENKRQTCVYYDAWLHDNNDDPIVSLLYSISKELRDKVGFDDDAKTLKILESIISDITKIDLNVIKGLINSASIFKDVINEEKLKQNIVEYFNSIIEEKSERLIIIIDELDRCNPNYTIKLLERIKHYFDSDRITFIFSINLLETTNILKTKYGQEFDAYKYLDRFFDLKFEIAELNKEKFFNLINFKFNSVDYLNEVMLWCINELDMSMRDIIKYVNITNITLGNIRLYNNSYGYHVEEWKFYCCYFIVPIMLALKTVDINKYYDFVEGEDNNYFIKLMNEGDFGWANNIIKLQNETFDKDSKPKNDQLKQVDKYERLNRIYQYIFGNGKKDYETHVGQLLIDNECKKYIDKIQSLVSSFSNFDNI